mmetsp:Transcript_4607/g.10023  ORF Transcript_4607/g.10023 Transcript_4607/m.10023 type:complete len:371 (-) Transcript_4607:230-1342(-)|eukprot:839792-Pleurochrysis_carterae.AAC.1
MGLPAACIRHCLHGVCTNGTCVCDPGWSGSADLLTGDLTAWGGPVLFCNSNLQMLTSMWWITLGQCTLALMMAPVTLYQQWEKLKSLRTQGFRKRWFQYRPLLFVAGHATITTVIFLHAANKVSTPDLQRVVGIDPLQSISFMIVYVLGVPLSCAYLLDVLATFSGGIRGEIAQEHLRQRLLDVARFCLVLASFILASTGLYVIVCLSVSPLSGRDIHALCGRLMAAHIAVSTLLSVIACSAFTVEILRNINHTLRERAELARWTRSSDMTASLQSLRRTRVKVISVQLTVIIVCVVNCGVNFWMAIDSSGQQYASYKVAYMAIGHMQIVLFVLLTYTSVSMPSGQRMLKLSVIHRLTPSATSISPGPSA